MSFLRARPPQRVMRDLPVNVYKQPDDSTIQYVEDVSTMSNPGSSEQGYYKRKGKWDYLVQTKHPVSFWGDLQNTHVPAKTLALKKKPGMQERSWKPVLFAAVQFPDGAVGYRLGWDNNWLRLVRRESYEGMQLFRMMSGDIPKAIILKDDTANELFGPM